MTMPFPFNIAYIVVHLLVVSWYNSLAKEKYIVRIYHISKLTI